MPRVSVIIATYNWSSVLPYSIGSVLGQTFTDFEVLVVGDGCTDDSEQVVRNIADSRVRWINLPANTGHQAGPNNEGLRRASADIIAYLGHDDLWFPHHLEAAIRTFDSQSADVAYALVASIGPDDRFVLPCVPQPRRGLFSPPSGMLHRREVTERAGGWRNYRDLRIGPDTDLFRRAYEMGCAFVPVSRLGALKFPASWREGVYRTRPSHEQAAWTRKMREDPALEASVMARIIAECGMMNVSYIDLIRHLFKETARRVSRPSFLPWRRGGMIDAIRAYKGL